MDNMKEIANGVWQLTIGQPEGLTPVTLREIPIAYNSLKELPARQELPDLCKDIGWKQTNRGIIITLPMETGEDIYGFGLQLRSFNHTGRKRLIRVNSDPPADTGEGHAPIPFYISTAGYGLFADTFRYAAFYMGTSTEKGVSADRKEENVSHKEFSESALYSLKKAKEKRKIIIEIPSVKGIDLYFFAGDVKETVQRYNLFSGGGCLPPAWGLGMWYRTYGGSDQEKVLSLAEQFRRENIPVDVFGLEPGWHSHSYSCTYKWSYLFPKPKEMIDSLNQMDYKINLWEHIFVYPAADFYDDIRDYSGDYEVWNGLVPDFATKEACEIFENYHRENFVKKGIKGFKLDECDSSDYNASNWSFPDSASFPSGLDGEQMHSALGILYQRLIYHTFRNENVRTYSQVRSSGALAAPFPFVLYSDLYEHKQFIRGMATAGFSGLLWAPEVRSCVNGNDLLRRMETVIFSSHALFNCWRIPNPPWKQVDIQKNLENEFMEDSIYYTDVCRKFFKLRMQLIPYLYSAFVKYQETGLPPVRAVVMDYPMDINVRTLDDEYMFGESMLVCPLTLEDGTSRKVYLPGGIWHNFFTGEVLKGNRTLTIEAAYDEIPVFVKDNSLIPLAEPVNCVSEDTVFRIHICAYGTGAAEFVLYEDDFESFEWERGDRNQLRITKDELGNLEIVRMGKGKKRYEIIRS